MSEPRIAPLDPDTVDGELKTVVENNRKMFGKPLQPYLVYGRSPAVLRGASAMWAATHSFKRIDPKLRSLLNRRVASWNGCEF